MACCKFCNVELVAGYKGKGNWNPSWENTGNLMCKPCFNKKYRETNNKWNSKYNPTTNANMLYINGKYISRKDPRYKMIQPGSYKISDGLIEAANVGVNKKEGYIYALVNPNFDNWVKIGMAEDVTKRLATFNTAYPERDGQMVYNVKVSNMRKAEKIAHRMAKKIANRTENEWFTLTVTQAVDILNSVGSEVIEKKKEQVKPATQDLFNYAETGT